MNIDASRAAAKVTGSQRIGGLVEMPALLRDLGVQPDVVLAAAGLEPQALQHIDQRLPLATVDRLLTVCVEHTGCPHFGLLAGQRWHVSHQGILGEMMKTAPTVGDALRRFTVVQHLNSDLGAAFLLEHEEVASFGFALFQSGLTAPEQVYDCAMAVAANMMRGLCRLHWTAREVWLARPVPVDAAPYKAFFGPRLRFDQTHSAVRFSSRWLTQAAPDHQPERHQALLEVIAAHHQADLVPRLQRALRLLLIQGHCSGDALAATLSLHRRTLNRRLQAQGTTFQKLLDEVRLGIAQELLGHTHSSIDEVASALCYADVSAFMHAFKRWTGTTPAHFRQTHGRG